MREERGETNGQTCVQKIRHAMYTFFATWHSTLGHVFPSMMIALIVPSYLGLAERRRGTGREGEEKGGEKRGGEGREDEEVSGNKEGERRRSR